MFSYPRKTWNRAAAPPHGKKPVEMVRATDKMLLDASLGRHVLLGGDLKEAPRHAGGTVSLFFFMI